MKRRHDKPARPARVAEPVQVYLDPAQRATLERLAAQLGATKSDVLRRGLDALESLSRRASTSRRGTIALPTFAGQGLQPGVDLDDTASLIDLMQEGDDAPP
jgi:NurA-like 5'-3' nuclease